MNDGWSIRRASSLRASSGRINSERRIVDGSSEGDLAQRFFKNAPVVVCQFEPYRIGVFHIVVLRFHGLRNG